MPSSHVAVFVEAGAPFEIREVPLPDPGPGEVLVEVVQANVCGSDLHLWRGEIAPEVVRDVVLGHELVGRVVAAGDGAERDSAGTPLAPGDPLAFRYFAGCGHCGSCGRGREHHCAEAMFSAIRPAGVPPFLVGGFARHYLVTAGQARFRLPDGLAPEVAAGANCALAQVVHGLDLGGLRAGEAAVVQGCGGLGLYAVAVARARGADPVVAVDPQDGRLALARRFGAHHVVGAATPAERVAAVLDATGGWGGDVVVEVAGVAAAVEEGLQMTAPGGRYVELGSIVPGQRVSLDPTALIAGNRTILGAALYPDRALFDALRFLAAGSAPFEELVGATFPLERIDEAFATAEAESASVARVAVRP